MHIQKKYFKAWRLGAGMDKKEPTETDPIVSKEGKEDKQVVHCTNISINIPVLLLLLVVVALV